MSLYPVSTDRHVSFTAHDQLYENTPWHYPHRSQRSSCHSELSCWQSTSRPSSHYLHPPPPYQSTYRPIPYQDPTDFHPSSHLLSDYSESSQKPYRSSNYSPALSASSCVSQPSPVGSNWSSSLYFLEDEDSPTDSRAPSASSVKNEPEESFIMELRATPCPDYREIQTPSSNVPLRATHACGEMLSMMGVFRLDPFIVRGSTWKPEENIGLTEEPIMFEFTLELPGEPESETWPADDEAVEDTSDLAFPEGGDLLFSNHDSLYYRDSYTDCIRSSRGYDYR